MDKKARENAPILYNKYKDIAMIVFNDGDTYTFDDEITMQVKTNFAKDYGYGGIFNWSFDCDKTFKLLNITKTIKK